MVLFILQKGAYTAMVYSKSSRFTLVLLIAYSAVALNVHPPTKFCPQMTTKEMSRFYKLVDKSFV